MKNVGVRSVNVIIISASSKRPPFFFFPPPLLLEYVIGASTWVMGTSRDSLGLPDNCTAPIFNRLRVVFSWRSLKNSPRRDHQAEWSPVQDLLAGRMGRLISRRGWTDMLSGGPLNPISYLSEGELSCIPQSSTAPAHCSPRLCTCHQTRNGPLKVASKKMETDANGFPLHGAAAQSVTLKCRCFCLGLCVCHDSAGEKKCARMWS